MLEFILETVVEIFLWTFDWHRWWLWLLIVLLLIIAIMVVKSCL